MARRVGPGRALAEAAAALGALPWPHCPRRCLAALARLLTKGEVLGAAEKWGAAEAAAAGALAGGLPNAWKILKPVAAGGLRPAAVRCIPPPDFEELSAEQAESLSVGAVAALSEAQLERVRDPEARAALEAALADAPPASLLDDSAAAAAPAVSLLALALPLALALTGSRRA
ncbi:hypothetical protein R5R35_006526 [Gryllus longicercus]|uniref:Uncharacterized protein n=1 Tax=Gryllus longicercus TaxID=2509291 RepID=A0AAN9Z1Y0_9ORTH